MNYEVKNFNQLSSRGPFFLYYNCILLMYILNTSKYYIHGGHKVQDIYAPGHPHESVYTDSVLKIVHNLKNRF